MQFYGLLAGGTFQYDSFIVPDLVHKAIVVLNRWFSQGLLTTGLTFLGMFLGSSFFLLVCLIL